MGEARAVVAALAACVAGLLTPAAAEATIGELELKGSNGYTVGVLGFDDSVGITAERRSAGADYSAKGVATSRRMKVDLGRFGEVAVRFTARRARKVSPPSGCTGRKATLELGTWKGTIRFRGERGYTSVDAVSAPGSVQSTKGWRCKAPGEHGKLLAASKGTTAFFAGKVQDDSDPFFAATRFESAKRITILRYADVTGKRGSFGYPRDLKSARARPPAPFAGRADFRTPNKLAGSLKVDFPGRAGVRVGGAGWRATFGEGDFDALAGGDTAALARRAAHFRRRAGAARSDAAAPKQGGQVSQVKERFRCNVEQGTTTQCFTADEEGDTYHVSNDGNTYSVRIVERKTDGGTVVTELPRFTTRTITFAPRSAVFIARDPDQIGEVNAVRFGRDEDVAVYHVDFDLDFPLATCRLQQWLNVFRRWRSVQVTNRGPATVQVGASFSPCEEIPFAGRDFTLRPGETRKLPLDFPHTTVTLPLFWVSLRDADPIFRPYATVEARDWRTF